MPVELSATLGKSQIAVVLEPLDGGRYKIAIDGREREVEARLVRPGTWSLLVDGESHLVDVEEKKSGELVLQGAGAETTVKLEDARRKRMAESVLRGGGHAAGGEVVRAPIAGKVVKVLVAVGDKVKPGDAVAVVEAMKMENEIRAVRGGVVRACHAAAGQSIESQEQLVSLE